MEATTLHISNLGGGMVDGVPALDLQDSQWENLLNVYPFGTKLVRRKGAEKLTITPAAAAITGLALFAEDGSHYLIAGMPGGFAWNDGGAMKAIARSGAALAEDSRPWSITQYKTEMFAVRPGSVLQRLDRTSVADAGIGAPPAFAAGVISAGSVTAGAHTYFVTFETDTGNRSPASPSVIVDCPSASTVSIAVPTSTSMRVTQRSIWRTLANDPGQAWLLTVIDNNTTTIYTDDKADAELGEAFEYGNVLPPTTECRMLAQWNQRLWLIDDSALYATRPGLFETFDQTFEGFDQYSGHVMRGVCAFGDVLVVGTTRKIFGITQTGVDESGVRFDIDVLSEEHGVAAGATMASAEGRLFWFGGDNVYEWSGGQATSISTVEIRGILDRARARSARWEYAVASVKTDLGWYLLSLSVDSDTENDTLLVYNYRTGKWTVFRYFSGFVAPSAMTAYFDESYASANVAAFATGHIYQLNTGEKDGPDVIFSSGRGKAFQKPASSTMIEQVSVNCTTAFDYLTIQVFRDGIPIPVMRRAVYLSQAAEGQVMTRDWKRFAMSPRRLMRSFQFGFEYFGESPFELNEILFEVSTFDSMRRPV